MTTIAPCDPVATLNIAGGGLGKQIHLATALALETVSEDDRRFISSVSLDSDVGSSDSRTTNQYQLGQISNVESGGHDDPSVVQAIAVRDDLRRSSDSVLNRHFGARGDRVAGHKAFEDDFATREIGLVVIGRELKRLDAMNPQRIDVHIFGGIGGAIGSNLLIVGPELVDEAARRAGVKSPIRVTLHCLSPNLVMADLRPQYLDENAVATLRDVNTLASGFALTFLVHDRPARVPDEVLFHDVNYRSAHLHSNTGLQELQRVIPASIVEIVRTTLDLSRAASGATLRSNFINTIDPQSENVFRIVQGQGVFVPATAYVDVATPRTVLTFLNLIARRMTTGEPEVTLAIPTMFNQEISTAGNTSKVLFQEIHQSSLTDEHFVFDTSWQPVVEIVGVESDRTIYPIEAALPVHLALHITVDRKAVERFAEDLANHHESSLAEARETFGAGCKAVVAEFEEYCAKLFDKVINGRGAYSEERNRVALYRSFLNLLETHLDRLLAEWRAVFAEVSTVHDADGGRVDKRKLLTEQIDGELSQAARSLVCRWIPMVGWITLRNVRGLAAERLDIDLLAIALEILETMAADLRARIRMAESWAGSVSSILEGIEREAARRLADAENALTVMRSYGPAMFVGEERLRDALEAVQRQESDGLLREVSWSLEKGRVTGTVATIVLEQARRGVSTPSEKNYELTSRTARAACVRAASQVDVTSCITEEFGTPDRLLDALRRSVNPEAEVELDGIRSSARPAKSIVVTIPSVVAVDAVEFIDEFKRSLRDEEKINVTDASEIRYISAIAGVPLQRLRFVGRAGRAYVTSDRVLHVSETLERIRIVSRELYRVRGIVWIPPVSIALLLDDPANLRRIAIATATGLLRGVEMKVKGVPVSVWATPVRKPSAANPPVTVVGLDLLPYLDREPMRSDVSKAVDRFDAQSADRRLDALTHAQEALIARPPACLGGEKDLLRLIDIALMAEVTRLQRTSGRADR